MTERLTFENFFTKTYLLHPRSQDLNKKDHNKALFYSVIFGIFTLGLVHLGYAADRAVKSWCFKPIDGKNKLTDHKAQDVATIQNISGGQNPQSPRPTPKANPPLKEVQPPPKIEKSKNKQTNASPPAPPLTPEEEEERKQLKEQLDQIEIDAQTTPQSTQQDLKRRSVLAKIISLHRNDSVKKCLNDLLLSKKKYDLTFIGKDNKERKVSKCLSKGIIHFLDDWKKSKDAPSEKQVLQGLGQFPSNDLLIVCLSIKNAQCL